VLLKQVEELEELRTKAELSVRLAGEVANLRADQTQQNRKLRDMQVQRDDARAELANFREHMQRARDEARTNEVTAQADIRKLKGFLQRNAEDVRISCSSMYEHDADFVFAENLG
jgi:chromosome segregation ATPase